MKEIKGRCLCGCVEYAISDVLKYAGYCHCSECRRLTGSAFSASGGVARSHFQLLKGESNLTCFEKVKGSLSYFCKDCSSLVYGDVDAYNMIYVLLGTLDEAPSLKPQWHIYTDFKVSWYEIHDDLPQYKNGII